MRRIAIVFAAAGIALVALAGPAWAHINVEPGSAPKGSDAVIGFVVPNEKEDATTTKVKVQFPSDHPIAEALVEAMPGWKAEAAEITVKTPIQTDAGPVTKAVGSITWTATGAGIAAGDFAEFRVSVGLPDDTDSLGFPTTQTYSDGSTVDWVQVSPAGGPEADNPEPVLTLTAGEGGGNTATPTTAANGTAAGAVSKSDVDSAKTIAIIGIVAGVLGLLVGAAAIVMIRRKRA